MSTLTKILIVLLAFASIFLCGIVVTYVANADSYKQKLNELSTDRDSLNKKVRELTKQINEKTDQVKQLEDKLSGEIASLNASKSDLTTKLENSEREKSALLAKVDSLASVTKDFYQTNDKQGQVLKNTLEQLTKVQKEDGELRGELDRVRAKLEEKGKDVNSLEAEKHSLMEQKAQLQDKIDQMLNPSRKPVKTAAPVVGKKETAKPVEQAGGTEVALQGKITAVDLKNSMASVSVGKTDGVKVGTEFYVIRGDEVICDIEIIDVEATEAVGILKLMQKQPKVGDIVSTEL